MESGGSMIVRPPSSVFDQDAARKYASFSLSGYTPILL
jgi:hypothetical protein